MFVGAIVYWHGLGRGCLFEGCPERVPNCFGLAGEVVHVRKYRLTVTFQNVVSFVIVDVRFDPFEGARLEKGSCVFEPSDIVGDFLEVEACRNEIILHDPGHARFDLF